MCSVNYLTMMSAPMTTNTNGFMMKQPLGTRLRMGVLKFIAFRPEFKIYALFSPHIQRNSEQ